MIFTATTTATTDFLFFILLTIYLKPYVSVKQMNTIFKIEASKILLIRTHLAYIANAKKLCYIKQQFTVLKARAS